VCDDAWLMSAKHPFLKMCDDTQQRGSMSSHQELADPSCELGMCRDHQSGLGQLPRDTAVSPRHTPPCTLLEKSGLKWIQHLIGIPVQSAKGSCLYQRAPSGRELTRTSRCKFEGDRRRIAV
jgi:hypothetical protein